MPTITIFVPLLIDKAVSMLKHIMEIVNGNTEFINAGQPPPYLVCFIECLGPLSVHDWLKWIHDDD